MKTILRLLAILFLFAMGWLLPACGQAPADLAAGGAATDKCFDLRGNWGIAPDSINFGDSGSYQYCKALSQRCGNSTFFIHSKNADGSYQISNQAVLIMGGLPHPDCPVDGISTCRLDVSGNTLTMDCGAVIAFARQP